jgi:type I restriction enzyme S subunit
MASQPDMDAVDALIVRAYELRDEANAALSVAESRLHSVLGVSPFTDDDVEYLGSSSDARAFTVSSEELAGRLDASNHLPLARSALKKLQGGNWRLAPLGELCDEIRIPPRFKRSYVAQDVGVPYLLPSQLMAQRPQGLKALSKRQAREIPAYLLKEGEVLLTTDGTIGRVHPVTARMAGWFGSNNMARLSGEIDGGFLYAFLATPYGLHQVTKDTYGGVIDHINEEHREGVVPRCADRGAA